MTFGQRLRTARKEKQLTQKELAAKINAAHNLISYWENDQNMPNLDTIHSLCWASDVQPNDFSSIETSLPSIILPLTVGSFQDLPGRAVTVPVKDRPQVPGCILLVDRFRAQRILTVDIIVYIAYTNYRAVGYPTSTAVLRVLG